jgi:hypothetical protein
MVRAQRLIVNPRKLMPRALRLIDRTDKREDQSGVRIPCPISEIAGVWVRLLDRSKHRLRPSATSQGRCPVPGDTSMAIARLAGRTVAFTRSTPEVRHCGL